MGSGDEATTAVAAAAADGLKDVVLDSSSSSSSIDTMNYFRHGAIDDSVAVSTIASAMMFGTILFAMVGMMTRTWLAGDPKRLMSRIYHKERSSALDSSSYESILTLLYHFSTFGIILFIAYICEHHPPFPHSTKSYDRDEFFFLTAAMFLVSLCTIQKNKDTPNKNKNYAASSSSSLLEEEIDHYSRTTGSSTYVEVKEATAANEVLNREQTEEWKGWMQFIFLIYHYYHAEEVYNSIRIMITCYVWMTGFGNFSFFYLKADYSFIRVVQMLWRLNFLVVFLCLTQGTTYILYYICPLHTYFFVMVYLTMRTAKHLNYTKYGLRFKLACVSIIIFLMWDVDWGIFRMVHGLFLGTESKLGANSGTLWEWYFRSSLDHWSTFLGMLFALNFPITSLFFRKLEAQSSPRASFIGKFLVGIALFMVFGVWFLVGPFQQPKQSYNMTNAYFGFIPLMTYIYFRNLTPTLRSYSCHFLQDIGKTTLETYLMQHHIWLTSNAKSLLTIIPGWPKINMLIATFIYFLLSRKLYRLTLFLRGMLLPDDNQRQCIKSLSFLTVTIGLFYAVAFLLQLTGHMSLFAVAVVSIICGYLLYQTIMDMTWHDFQQQPQHSSSQDEKKVLLFPSNNNTLMESDSTVSKSSPPLVGAMVVLIVGTFWQGMAMAGAGKMGVPLHAGCDAWVNDGKWIPIHGCHAQSRGDVYRQDGIVGLATCGDNGAYVWGWKQTKSFTHCQFSRRSSQSLKESLKDRRLVFIGDSITRNLFHAFCRSLGNKKAGAFDTTQPKHAGINVRMNDDTIQLIFKWAPLAVDQYNILKELNEEAVVPTNPDKSDLIVIGGGTWDRLHVYATDEDQLSHRNTVKKLVKEITMSNEIGSPVAWLIPTTINTQALNTADKRDHMKEEDMEEMRTVYASLGVLSSSAFVIDGPGFTKDRVEEAYDGVHYPLQVYDAGSQILANALDWLLPPKQNINPTTSPDPPSPGSMAQPFLGLMMLCLTFISLIYFDGFLGFLYTASLYVKGVMPSQLYEEAYTKLHRSNKLPAINFSSNNSFSGMSMTSWTTKETSTISSKNTTRSGSQFKQRKKGDRVNDTLDNEIASLLNNGKTEPI